MECNLKSVMNEVIKLYESFTIDEFMENVEYRKDLADEKQSFISEFISMYSREEIEEVFYENVSNGTLNVKDGVYYNPFYRYRLKKFELGKKVFKRELDILIEKVNYDIAQIDLCKYTGKKKIECLVNNEMEFIKIVRKLQNYIYEDCNGDVFDWDLDYFDEVDHYFRYIKKMKQYISSEVLCHEFLEKEEVKDIFEEIERYKKGNYDIPDEDVVAFSKERLIKDSICLYYDVFYHSKMSIIDEGFVERFEKVKDIQAFYDMSLEENKKRGYYLPFYNVTDRLINKISDEISHDSKNDIKKYSL